MKRFGTVINLTFTVLAFVFVSEAQPGWDYSTLRMRVAEVNSQIEVVDKKIAESPNTAGLYGQRGLLRVELYKRIYVDGYDYLPPYVILKEFPNEFRETLELNSLADLKRAIDAKPTAEYFIGRGNIYSWRWSQKIENINWFEEMRAMNLPEWQDFLEPRNEEHELMMVKKVLSFEDFGLARDAFEKSLISFCQTKSLLTKQTLNSPGFTICGSNIS